MTQDIRTEIIKLSEGDYKKFSSSLIPGCHNILGVRLPNLRSMAKEYAKNVDWEEMLEGEDIYFEETMLRGMIIGEATNRYREVDKGVKYLYSFVKQVDNWSVCDSFCTSFKVCRYDYDRFLAIIDEFINSNDEFTQRVGYVLFMAQYLKVDNNNGKIKRRRLVDMADIENDDVKGRFTSELISYINRPVESGYYASMAAAWLTAEAFLVEPKTIWQLLTDKENKMDDVTYNKAISKICESKNPSDKVKEKLKQMKRKRGIV